VAALGSVGKFTEFWRVLRDLNPEAVRRDVERGFTLALLGADEAGRSALRRALQPAAGHAAHQYLLECDGADALPRADLYFYVANAEAGLSGADVSALEQLYLSARPAVLVFAGDCGPMAGKLQETSRDLGGLVGSVIAIDPYDPQAVERHLAGTLLETLPNRSLAMARSLSLLRARTAAAVIAETSRVNAEFALLSNLPADIPILGTLMGAGADFLILTKNQAMMVLKLAAVYGRPLHDKWRLAIEIAPVVGAAFAWRTISRLLVGSLPTPIAAVPKMAIAYAGTFVVGRMARYYFEYGERPSRQTVRQFADEAAADWQRTLAGSADLT